MRPRHLRGSSTPGACAAVLFLLLAATAEERTFGTFSDEQQMLDTAVSIATTGEIGIARGQQFGVARPAGDAVSPYGMGLTLVEVPFAAVAGPWEGRFGARTSQTLFVLLEVLLVTAAATGAGLVAAELGAGAFGQGLAVFGTGVASPLWAYTSCGFSEPLQAACLVFAVLFGLRASTRERRAAPRRAAAAGFFVGWLVLTKVVNLVFVPFALLPLVLGAWPPPRERLRVWAAAAAGAAGPLATMLAFEVVRFGRPFSSYGDQSFSHPFLDGAVRLLVGANKGLFLYFPLAALSAAALVLLARAPGTRGAAAAVACLTFAFLAVYARWWAWDGNGGWGPRFLVPVIPVLAAAAGAVAVSPGARAAGALLLVLGIGVNALGVFESEAATFFYFLSAGAVEVPRSRYDQYPASLRPPGRDGKPTLPLYLVAASDAAFSAFRIHPFLLANRLRETGVDARRDRLAAPPWLGERPEPVPKLPPDDRSVTVHTPLVVYLTAPFRWPHLFMSFTRPRGESPGAYNPAWFAALADQTFRNLDIGRPGRAARFADTLFGLSPSAFTAALRLESLRRSGQDVAAGAFLRELPDRVRRAPVVVLVEALRARDEGQDLLASTLMAQAARGIPTPAVRSAAEQSPSTWPPGLRELLSGGPDRAAAASR
jgi:hypothetical protein